MAKRRSNKILVEKYRKELQQIEIELSDCYNKTEDLLSKKRLLMQYFKAG